MKNIIISLFVLFSIALSCSMAVGAEKMTRLDCINICVAYNMNNKCTKAQKFCYEVKIEETSITKEIDIYTGDLTPPTQSCISADGKAFKCN